MSGAKREIKIAYIGGGSQGWAPALFTDLALCEQLTGALALYDIDRRGAEFNVTVARRFFDHPDARTRFAVSVEATPAAALKGADFVVMSIEPGPITMRYAELEIPRQYGIIQPVADSVGPGGWIRALRTIPTYVGYARQIMRHCPKAWVINFTNPMTLCTQSLYAAEPSIKAFGCCHEVFGTQHRLSELIARWFKVPAPPRSEIKFDLAGVNHFTFATAATWKGIDLFPRLRELVSHDEFFKDRTAETARAKRKAGFFGSHGLISFDLFRRFGALGAAGDRHLAEFVPWYLGDEKTLHRWGVLLTPYAWRVKWDRMKKRHQYAVPEKLHHTGEEAVEQMLAILGFAPMDTNVNVPNRGQSPDLPLGAVVESNSFFRLNEVRPAVSGALPEVLAGHMRRVVANQQNLLQAALAKDKDRAFQVLLNDPLVRIPTDQAYRMMTEMLRYTRSMLPGWKI